MATGALHLGIDLGTTNSTAAVFDGTTVHLVRNAQGTSLTPSVVRIDAKGNATVGHKARKLLENDPDNVRGEFKRLMGTAQKLSFPAAKLSLSPEELSAKVLSALRTDVQEQFGFAPAKAVISVPALFELPQSQATSEAARLAGFERVELIQEPIASALSAGWTRDQGQGSWLVYDLGGGTFDASLLETRDGLLRVVGHDGDNFLGGRDFDNVLVDLVLEQLSQSSGQKLSRAEAKHARGLRRLKLAVEDAKIELTRAESAQVLLPAVFDGESGPLDVDVTLKREDLERLTLPLIDRSIAVCLRLLKTHGLEPSQLTRLVLVGGPTVMPLLRNRLKVLLGAPLTEGLDAMTLVAQGAALYAATAGLDARPAKEVKEEGRKLWLQFPAMTSDLAPHVVGRFVESDAPGPNPVQVQLERDDGKFKTAEVTLNAEQAFVLSVDVLPRRPNVFKVIAKSKDGKVVPTSPASFTIVQGLTLSDPPLSRTLGVATANDFVQVYFERGAPLPARRTFRHHTVETLIRGDAQSKLRIPIVQGEFERAHLNRLVGSLEVTGEKLKANLPSDSEVELTLELDRGGRLSAKALVLSTQQVFEEVAQLLVPDATPEALHAGLSATRSRLGTLRAAAYRHGLTRSLELITGVEAALRDVEFDLQAARGGDADAAQRARRSLLEADATLEEVEIESKWPELEESARSAIAWASSHVSQWGTPPEQKLLDEAAMGVERARKARQVLELQRRVRQVRQLGTAAYYRHPEVWSWEFEAAAGDAHQAKDLPRANQLVSDGRKAIEKNDTQALKTITQQLWRLLPASVQDRAAGHGSSLR